MKVKNITAVVVDFDNLETLWGQNETKQIEFYYDYFQTKDKEQWLSKIGHFSKTRCM